MHMYLNCKTNFFILYILPMVKTIFSDGEIYSSSYLQKQIVNLIFRERDIKALCIGRWFDLRKGLYRKHANEVKASVLMVES